MHVAETCEDQGEDRGDLHIMFVLLIYLYIYIYILYDTDTVRLCTCIYKRENQQRCLATHAMHTSSKYFFLG